MISLQSLAELGPNPIAYAGIFLGILMAFEGLRQTFSKSESVAESRNRRMRMIAKGVSAEQILNVLKPAPKQWGLASVPYIGSLPTTLNQAGIGIKPRPFLMLLAAGTLLIGTFGSLIAYWPIAIGFAVLVGFVIPVAAVRSAARRRMDALEKQLPDALDLMARGLIVGHPLNTTIGAVAREMTDPVATDFGIMTDQIAFGDDLVEAFMDFAERTEIEDVRYLAISVAIQNGTGGNLGEILQTLAKVIRDRISMRKRIQAISSEGRLTSIFLSLLPVFILVSTSLTNPGYYGDVSGDPLFVPFALVVLCFGLANFLVLRRLVDFRI